MRELRYHLVDVFTTERFGGNPLAVFTDGAGLSPALMQRIAKELNLSETTFVLPPQDAANDFQLRIFTPAVELPMAGHPTVGTAYVLAREGLVTPSSENPVIHLEEQVGVIPVRFQFQDGAPGLITMQQPAPTFGPTHPDRVLIAAMLSLDVSELDDHPLEVVSCGVPFLFVPIRNLPAMQRIKLRIDIWERALRDFVTPHVFVFSRETEHRTSTVHSRMFAPAMGIAEDPATGGASGPLGCYLVKHGYVKGNPARIISEQGLEMGRPSFITIEIGQQDEQITSVSVGGQCVSIGSGTLIVEESDAR
ncbi:MAG: PhzF family phenazine biosynthesis protein [Anaerolineae bacterium]|nr:PhzF family phenazine biosynthesis protein [Anaerolineae bacterium]